ncbi:MAG TPA: TonB family protein [Vicinamibacterales bacterium]|nr:TonB family protein [Vicinamibacterales bacterium]
MTRAVACLGLLALLAVAAPRAAAAQTPPTEQDLLARMSRQPGEIGTYLDLAKLYTGAQRYAEAEDMLARATALVRAAKSQVAAKAAQSTTEQELQARVAASPNTIGHHLALAQFYADAGRSADAQQALARATELVRRARLGPAAAAGGSTPIRVGGNIAEPRKIMDVKPVYPQAAQDAKVQGVVILEVVIDTTGGIRDAKVLRSIPMLDQAALDAVKQWRFTPTLLNGAPQEVIMTVTMSFTLGGL